MRSPLETLLAEELRSDSAAAERALRVAREELARKRPVRSWRTQAAWMFAASALLTTVVAGVMWGVGASSGAVLLGRAPLLALLWATSAVCAWGALSPRRGRLPLWGIGMAMVSATVLVLARSGVHAESTLPEWVCTASHVGLGLIPLVVAVVLLRSAAFRPLRAVLAGLSVGTTGAFVGELACAQGWRHVLGYHLSAWVLIAVATFAVSRSLLPRSFAP
ncbi:DUF1109 domain-containing protein [Archangium minus]|uniref:DUF1109 domain-containing protein n=1 Tax=Archangium minus TaxID=83450 RepID=A0ABY9WY26_9BACT|nr:DUF1109 domain-containing protein [Archangium minus]